MPNVFAIFMFPFWRSTLGSDEHRTGQFTTAQSKPLIPDAFRKPAIQLAAAAPDPLVGVSSSDFVGRYA